MKTKNGIRIAQPKKVEKPRPTMKDLGPLITATKQQLDDIKTIRGGHCPQCNSTLVLSDKIPNTFYRRRVKCLSCKEEYKL